MIIRSFLPDFSTSGMSSTASVQRIMAKISEIRGLIDRGKISETEGKALIAQLEVDLQIAKGQAATNITQQEESDRSFVNDVANEIKKISENPKPGDDELNRKLIDQIAINNRVRLNLT
jgi:polyhydroxyalkanoate synthesis regulator phasin